MCQSRANGGRRCAFHAGASRAGRILAESTNGLTQGQVTTIFNSLRQSGDSSAPTPSAAEYRQLLTRLNVQAHRVTHRRQTILRALEAARNEEIDGRTFYALSRLQEISANQSRQLGTHVVSLGRRAGLTPAQSRRAFTSLVANPRAEILPEDSNPEGIDTLRVNDNATLNALRTMNRWGTPGTQDNERISSEPRVNARQHYFANSAVQSAGYSPEDGRLEVRFESSDQEDPETGQPRVLTYAFRNVTAEDWEALQGSSRPLRTFNARILSNPNYRYETPEQAHDDAYNRRCASCGQFAALSHTCPSAQETLASTTAGNSSTEVSNDDSYDGISAVGQDARVENAERELLSARTQLAEMQRELSETDGRTRRYQQLRRDIQTQGLAVATADRMARAMSMQGVDEPTSEVPTTELSARVERLINANRSAAQIISVNRALNVDTETTDELNARISSRTREISRLRDIVERNTSERTRMADESEQVQVLRREVENLDREISGLRTSLGNTDGRTRMGRALTTRLDAATRVIARRNAQITELGGTPVAIENSPTPTPVRRTRTARNNTAQQQDAPRRSQGMRTAPVDNTPVAPIVPEWRQRVSRAWSRSVDQRTAVDYTDRTMTSAQGVVSTYNAPVSIRQAVENSNASQFSAVQISAGYAVRAGVTRGDVVTANLSTTHSGNTVSGQVRLWRTEQGWQAQGANTPNCTCAEYRANGNGRCPHTTAFSTPETLAVLSRSAADSLGWRDETRVVNEGESRVISLTEQRARNASSYIGTDTAPDVTGVTHNAQDTISSPRATDIRAALNFGQANITVEWSRSYDWRVSGNIRMHRNADGSVGVGERTLRCTCMQYREYSHCPHVDYVANQSGRLAVFGHASTHAQIGTIHEFAERQRLAAMREEEQARVLREQQATEQLRRDRRFSSHREILNARRAAQSPEELYANNYAEFETHVSAARAALRRGRSIEEILPYETNDATGGICAPDTGRKFGVEIEFDFPSTISGMNRSRAISAIGRDLAAAGLTRGAQQRAYHSAARDGYSNWSFESDATVSGEIVSPILSDTPQAWAQLKQVCDIVKRHGGVANSRTGSHVHISTGSYGRSIERHAQLGRMVNRYEDVIYRVATNPASGSHRPMSWCAPTTVTDDYISGARRTLQRNGGRGEVGYLFGSSHSNGMNYAASGTGSDNDHVEFRQWDGSLEPSVIQAQVKMSAAMVDAAERHVMSNDNAIEPLARRPIGTNYTRATRAGERITNTLRGAGTATSSEEDSSEVRSFVDELFHRGSDKRQIATLFAITSWQSNSQF